MDEDTNLDVDTQAGVSGARVAMVLPYVAGRSMTLAMRLVDALDGDLAGLAEVAEAAGRGKTEVSNRARNAGFPSPVVRLACGPVYSRTEVLSHLNGVNGGESDDV